MISNGQHKELLLLTQLYDVGNLCEKYSNCCAFTSGKEKFLIFPALQKLFLAPHAQCPFKAPYVLRIANLVLRLRFAKILP
jgi:hypothetical protein